MDPVTNYCRAILGEDESAKSVIRLIPELANCSDELLDMIFTYSKPVNLEPGEVLIKEGLFDQWVYFIISGDLEVEIEGKSLGSTSGPIVGERCILGEPRGANLLAGADGLMALGIEMTIIDELNREVNNYQKIAQNDEDFIQFSEKKMAVSLELLLIILSEIIGRIIEIHETGVQTFGALAKKRPKLNVQLQSLYSFTENSFEDESSSKSPKIKQKTLNFHVPNKTDEDESTDNSVSVNQEESLDNSNQNISVYSFIDFADVVYFEILQKHLSSYGYETFSHDHWKEVFKIGEDGNATITKAYEWLKSNFDIQNADLIEITYSIFEIASRYTAAANKSISQILAISSCDVEKKEAIDSVDIDKRVVVNESQDEILQKLFLPVEQKLQSSQSAAENKDSGKMNQSDIDALFG